MVSIAPRLLPILKLGHPVLRQQSKPLSLDEIRSDETRQLVRDMFHTLKKVGGIGLAAPQIGVSKQIVVLDCPELPESHGIPPTVLFNPVIDPLLKHERIAQWESCLSIPGLVARTRRYNNVLVWYKNEQGERGKIGASGFNAAVLQHEIDHLNGRLELDELESPQSVYFEEEWRKYHAHLPGITEIGDIKFYGEQDDDDVLA